MCGIFAYLNYNVSRERRYILEVLFNGLRRLEYRGYDSAGIALDADAQLPSPASPAPPSDARPYAGASPLVFRQEGKIENLVRSVYSGQSSSVSNLCSCRKAGIFFHAFLFFWFCVVSGLTCLFLPSESFNFDRGEVTISGEFCYLLSVILDDSILLLPRRISFTIEYWNRRLPKFRISVLINISNSSL